MEWTLVHSRGTSLMAKVADAGEDHRHLALVSGSNDFFVAHRAARLNRARCASFGCSDQPVWEREKSVACDGTALQRKPALVRFPNCNPRSIDPGHLAGANSKCPVRLRVHDRVRFHMFHDTPAEQHRV